MMLDQYLCTSLAPVLAEHFTLDVHQVQQVIHHYMTPKTEYLKDVLKPVCLYDHEESEPEDQDMTIFKNKDQIYRLRPPLTMFYLKSLTKPELVGLMKEYHIEIPVDTKTKEVKNKPELLKVLLDHITYHLSPGCSEDEQQPWFKRRNRR